MLEVKGVTTGYTSVPVLHDISITVDEGNFVSIVGPNGAGKSTLFKTISGVLDVWSGSIAFEGQDLKDVSASARPHLGIAHVPEGRQVFSSMTVLENLEMGAYNKLGRQKWKQSQEQIYEWFPVLKERESQLAGTLSGGQQQMLAIGRGLASSPRLLMLDEPSMGLAPSVADFIFDSLMAIRKESNLTILLVEQRVAEALEFAEMGYVLETGRIVLEGAGKALQADDRIRQAYLGM